MVVVKMIQERNRNIDRTVGPLEVRFLVLDSFAMWGERIAPKTSSSVAIGFDKPYSKSRKFACQAPPLGDGQGEERTKGARWGSEWYTKKTKKQTETKK